MSGISIEAQSSWEWRDPNDLGFIDFGDNKVLGYNLLGMGLVSLLDKEFSKDRSVLWSASVAGYHEYNRSPLSDLLIIEGRVGRHFRPYLTWGGGLRYNVVYGDGLHTSGVGGFAWFSWHIIRKDRWRLTYDNGVGPNYFIKAFPDGGTHFNFTTHYGLEFAIRIKSKWLYIQFSNIHISNAGIKGPDRNPALDAIGLTIGLDF